MDGADTNSNKRKKQKINILKMMKGGSNNLNLTHIGNFTKGLG